ncbi:MAG: cysteine-rich KTR domain-containing protein [Tyzzerella sp.]|nr:cysteine-rich KTR domain-containing protein [Tyzzerella sp.]
MKNCTWLVCPTCGGKTRNQVRIDTILKNYPLFCPKCKREMLINVENMNTTIIKEPDAKTQSQ